MNEQPLKTSTAAFFDVDGTLLKANVVRHYLNLAQRDKLAIARLMTIAKILLQVPYYLLLDRFSRSHFNRVFYRNYRQMSASDCQRWSQQYFEETLRDRLFLAAKYCIYDHQQRGDRIVLVTGSPNFIISPLAAFFRVDGAIATNLEMANGYYTGKIVGLPLAGEEKARSVRSISQQLGIDLSQSHAYGDSIADLPMLYTVGYPVAVNPSRALSKIAKKKGWLIQRWRI